MFDDLVYDLVIFNKGNNSHSSPAFGTDDWITAMMPGVISFSVVAFKYFISSSLSQTQRAERSERLNLKNIRSILGMVKTTRL